MKEVFETIFLLASIQGVLLSIMLFFKKSNHSANIFLSLAIFALSLDLLTAVYYSKGWYLKYIHLGGFTYPIALTYGPLFYFYTKYLTGKQKHFRAKDMLHFVPILSVYIIMLPVFFYPTNLKIEFVGNMIAHNQPAVYSLIESLIPLQGFCYTMIIIFLVIDYNKKIKDSFSNIEKINLNWLKYLVLGFIFCWVIVGISYIVDLFEDMQASFTLIIHAVISVIIYSIGYFSLNQPEIFSKQPDDKTGDWVKEKYKKSGLDDSIAEEIKIVLFNMMENQKPYRDSELTLNKLSEMIQVSTHNLSEVINSKLGKTYYDFINEYRVEEFKKKLEDPSNQNYNLISLAFDSGFNSKTSFNTIFKKITGLTPSQYKNAIKHQDNL